MRVTETQAGCLVRGEGPCLSLVPGHQRTVLGAVGWIAQTTVPALTVVLTAGVHMLLLALTLSHLQAVVVTAWVHSWAWLPKGWVLPSGNAQQTTPGVSAGWLAPTQHTLSMAQVTGGLTG